MSPRWLHWPAAATGATYTLSGDLVFSTSTRFNITNQAESGSVDDFILYTSQPIRDDGTAIRFIIEIDSVNSPWASIDEFVAAGGFSDVKFFVNGVEFAETSITYNSGAGALLQIFLNATSGDVTTFWSSMNNGDPFSLELYY